MSEWRPKLRADVRVLGETLVALDGGSGVELLEGRLGAALAHVLNGELAVSQIIAQIGGSSDTLDVLYELDDLRKRDLLEPEEPGPGAADPSILPVSDYLDAQLEAVNREALQTGRPWMLVRPRGTIVWIGPVFVPGRGPCWACMAARLRGVRTAWQLPERPPDDAPAVPPADPPSTRIALDLAALEAARHMRQPDAPSRLLTFDTQSLAQKAHVILRKPDCEACGDPAAPRELPPLVLRSRPKVFTLDGGHRAVAPEQTYERYAHLVSPLTGIVQEVRRADGDAGALNTFVARHNYTLDGRKPPDRSLGKGMTAAQARTGALCEALERYSGLYRGDEPLVRATFRELGDEAVHPHACLGISDRQYAAREEWNRQGSGPVWIPERFDEDAETDWAPAWSLTHGRRRYVAAAYCYYRHPHGANAFAHADSNGNAAGTCVEDAILQGLLELVERDSAGIWWYARARRPAPALETPYVEAMRHEHAARGRRLWLLDLTTDLGIPVCVALSAGEDRDLFRLGFGAHLDPAIAVTRAVTEVNQMLAAGSRTRRVYSGTLEDRTFLEPHGSRELSTAAAPSDDLREDVLACTRVLAASGLEVIVLDQTREDVGLPVTKVIVPGLRHFRPRFGPGRLYDVPLRLGWVERALREEDLNPSHLNV
ncbi:MAG TPA: TOMM precursor leader peptide-binding protein [Thermoanaerobaculia bacterium]